MPQTDIDRHNQACLALEAGDYALVTKIARETLEQSPDFYPAWFNLAQVHMRLGEYARALPCYQKAFALAPDHPEVVNGYGTALRQADRVLEAREMFLRAERLLPTSAKPLLNLCAMLNQRGEYSLADIFLHEARCREPDFVNVRWFDAMRLLRQGRYREGWPLFESRFALQGQRAEPRLMGYPIWSGQADVEVIVLREQGLGDCIQMVRFLPAIQDRARVLAVETPPELRRLFQANFPEVAFVPDARRELGRGSTSSPEFSLPWMSVGQALHLDAAAIPDTPYLKPVAADVSAWARILGPRRINVPRVGFFWAGNPRHANDIQRSMSIEQAAALTHEFSFDWVILQKPTPTVGREAFAGDCLWLGDELHDMADTAAVISQLDLVIGVDSAPIHLAGALGVPTWLLLPVAPDWRWGLKGEVCPWYGSLRLFRQNVFRNWDAPLIALRAALAALFPTAAELSSGSREGAAGISEQQGDGHGAA